MFNIFIKRVCEARAPYEICRENYVDWTHFSYVHAASHVEYRLLFANGRRFIFLYRARRLQFLPWFDDYIVFRESAPEGDGYDHVYLNVRSGYTHYLKARVVKNAETVSMVGEFVFCLPDYWRLFPRLFFLIFRHRMRVVMREDNEIIGENMRMGGLKTNPACAPLVPRAYDLLGDLFKDSALPDADVRFEDHVLENFEGVAGVTGGGAGVHFDKRALCASMQNAGARERQPD